MSPAEINQTIAEYLGVQTVYFAAKYNNHGREDAYIASTMEEAEEWPFHELGIEPFVYHARIPNYFGDLNTCFSMREKIPRGKHYIFNQHLQDIVFSGARCADFEGYPSDYLWHATAPQFCKAFLLTIAEQNG